MSVPNCNVIIEGKDIYSSTVASGFRGVTGFINVVINSVLFLVLFIIYLVTRNNLILLFVICFLAAAIYSYYQIVSGGEKFPERPCRKDGVILN